MHGSVRNDAIDIWKAGVAAVHGTSLVRAAVASDGSRLQLGDAVIHLSAVRRIVVVGAGKAAAAMGLGIEEAFRGTPELLSRLSGLLLVPEEHVLPLQYLQLDEVRPRSRNEPTDRAVNGTTRIIGMLESCHRDDLVIVLISGGASALLVQPVAGVSWQAKRRIGQLLSDSGASIRELNTVRKHLSRAKGGGLSRLCPARYLTTLVLSDVLGDPLDVIGSGPTVTDTTTPADALSILQRFQLESAVPEVTESLQRKCADSGTTSGAYDEKAIEAPPYSRTITLVGNLAKAMVGAAQFAERAGYFVETITPDLDQPTAEVAGGMLAAHVRRLANKPGLHCLITGGEPTVRLVPPENRGKGGRNQQAVLAAWCEFQELRERGVATDPPSSSEWALLAGGTDGEDGPTDAAGAILDSPLFHAARLTNATLQEHLARNDAYPVFHAQGALLFSGPTHTNVGDLHVVLTHGPPEKSILRP